LALRGDKVTGEWKKVPNEQLTDLYSLAHIQVIKSRMRWAGRGAHMGETIGAYWVLVGKPEVK